MSHSEGTVIRVGVLGLGFMGATHIAAYRAAESAGFPCKLTAVCDPKASRRRGELWDVGGNLNTAGRVDRAFDPQQVKGYEKPEELIADPDVDLISVCTRTDTHVELSIAALKAGKHVLVEKPVALAAADIRKVEQAAADAGRICMPAMCMRFWPGWTWLKQRVADGSLGKCHSATFNRLGSSPAWSTSFFKDATKSGGALLDLHIHDADFVRWCFGPPQSVMSTGRDDPTGGIEHVTTLYRFSGAPEHVFAEGGYDHTPGFGFRMRYVVVFENATADFDLNRESPLLLSRDGKSTPVELESVSGYDGEVRAILAAISGPRSDLPTLAEAAAVTEMLHAEAQSVRTGRAVELR